MPRTAMTPLKNRKHLNYLLEPYDPHWLGTSEALSLRLPSLSDTEVNRSYYSDVQQLVYARSEILLNKGTRTAVYAIANFDFPQGGKPKWSSRPSFIADKRVVGKDAQSDDRFYGKTDEHSWPWARGHLVMRQNAIQKPTGSEPEGANRVKDSSDMTFFFTNACIQAQTLNGDEIVELEKWVALRRQDQHEDNRRVVVITGPIMASYGQNAEDFQAIKRSGFPKRKDSSEELEEDMEIPAAFWKIIAYVTKDEELEVRALVIPQNESTLQYGQWGVLKRYAEAAVLGDAAASTRHREHPLTAFQVAVTDIERWTGLQFDAKLGDHNPIRKGERVHLKRWREPGSPMVERIDDDDTCRLASSIDLYIIAVFPSPVTARGQVESVTVFNQSGQLVDLTNIYLVDNNGEVHLKDLQPEIKPQAYLTISGSQLGKIKLANGGDQVWLELRSTADDGCAGEIHRVEYGRTAHGALARL